MTFRIDNKKILEARNLRTNENLKIRRKDTVILTNREAIKVLEVKALADVIITSK